MQAAGYIGDTPEDGLQLQRLVTTAVQAANAALVGPRRLWVLGGAGKPAPGPGPILVASQGCSSGLCLPAWRCQLELLLTGAASA